MVERLFLTVPRGCLQFVIFPDHTHYFLGLFLKVLNIDFLLILICNREIAASLNELSNRWCKQEIVEPDALKE